MISAFVNSSVNDVLLQTNPHFTSHFLNSSTLLKIIWLTQCCTTVKPYNRVAVRGHRSEDILKYFLFILIYILLVLVFPGSAEAHIRWGGNFFVWRTAVSWPGRWSFDGQLCQKY